MNTPMPTPLSPAAELPELLRPAIEKHREAADEARSLPQELFDELRSRGAFRLSTPREFGGYELPLAKNLDVLRRLGAIDGPVAWVVWNLNFGFTAAYLEEAGVERIWGAGPDPLIANAGQPGRLEAIDGGYLLSGEWKIVSGVDAADFVAVIGIPDATTDSETGAEVRICWVPCDSITIRDTWHTFGMRGSNSNAVVADHVMLPSELTMPFFAPPRIDRPLYRVPLIHLVYPGCAAVVLGMAQNAVDEVIRLAQSKVGQDGEPLSHQPRMQAVVARSNAKLSAAWLQLRAAAAELDRLAEARIDPTEADRGNLRAAICLAAETVREVVFSAYDAASSTPLYESSRLGQIFQDTMAATQHANLSAVHYELAGRTVFGLPANALFV